MLAGMGIYAGSRILDFLPRSYNSTQVQAHVQLGSPATNVTPRRLYVPVFAMLAMARPCFDLVLASVYKQKNTLELYVFFFS